MYMYKNIKSLVPAHQYSYTHKANVPVAYCSNLCLQGKDIHAHTDFPENVISRICHVNCLLSCGINTKRLFCILVPF